MAENYKYFAKIFSLGAPEESVAKQGQGYDRAKSAFGKKLSSALSY